MAERKPESPSIIAQHAAGASNPAGPLGLQQTEAAAHDVAAQSGPQSGSLIGQYAVDQGTTDGTARQWYTGANMEGVTNGWDTGFMSAAFTQYDEQQKLAQEQGDATEFYNWFDRDDATGVATWDDEDKGIARGDVYQNGKKVGNVYSDFDEKTANVMMAEFTLDGKTKSKIFADSNRDQWLATEVGTVLDQNSELAKNVQAAVEFQGNVDERQADILEGKSQDAITAAGVAGGLVTFGGAAALTGVGAVPGAIIAGAGGVLGGVSAYLNRDQLSEQVARAQEITALAGQKYGEMEAFSAGVKEWSGVGMRLIAPTSNLVQGLADGKRGDGESGFYAIDEDGKRSTSKWMRAADLGATLTDSVLQFSNPIGIAAYMTATGGHIAGQTSFMAQTGAGWNDRIGGFDDYEGSKEWAAAIGNVGIDVVQMGMAGGLVRAGAASRAAFGVEAPGVVGKALSSAREKLMPWRTGEVVERKTIQGMRFGLNEAGVAVTRRPTLELLAPSEAIRYVNTAWRARSRVALGTKPGHDDFYRAALETAGGNRFSQAIVTGWAEGAEEGVQAILEPVSFGADVDPWQVAEAVLYGAASGMGMGLGSMATQATTDQVQFSRANSLQVLRGQEPYTKDQWRAIDPDQRKRLAIADVDEARKIADTMKAMQRFQTFDRTNNSPISALALNDLSESLFARDVANANPNRDNVMVIAGMSADKTVAVDQATGATYIDDALPAHAGATSIYQALVNITNHQLAMGTVADDTERQMQALTEELGSAAADRAAEIQAQLQELTAELDMHDRTLRIGRQISTLLKQAYEDYRNAAGDVVLSEQAIDRFNKIIASAFAADMDINGAPLAGLDAEAARRSVEILVTRHPDIAADSFMLVMPFASKALSRANAHGQMQVHQSTLLAPGADHDGDTEVSVNFTRMPQASLDALRQGSQYITRTGDNETDTISVTVDPPDGEKTLVTLVSQGLNAAQSSPEWSIANDTVQGLVADLHARYVNHLPGIGLTTVLTEFRNDLRDGNPDARLNLVNGLYTLSPAGMRAAAAANGNVPEMPWLMQRITRAWDRYATDAAALHPDLEFTPKDVDAELIQDKAFLRANAKLEASTDGQTAYLATEGTDATREGQKLHYSVYRAAVSMAQGDMTTELFQRFVRLYAELGSSMSQSELARVRGRNAVEKRVAVWLQNIYDAAQSDPNTTVPKSLLMLANTQVQDVRLDDQGAALYDGDISLLQLLLRKSVEIEKQTHRTTLGMDEELQRRIGRLERLSRRDATEGNRSTTAQLALKEVFGSYQIHDLLGDSAKYLGPHLSLNQLVASLANRDEESRSDQLYRWKRKAPYVLHAEDKHNPPYTVEAILSGELSAYTVLVDTIAASVNTNPRRLKELNETTVEKFESGIASLRTLLEEFRALNSETLTDTSDIGVLRALLESNRQEVAQWVADLIPDAAKLGAFGVVEGRAVAARWVEEMLVMPPEQAAVTYAVNVRIAEWNAMGGNINFDELGEGTLLKKGSIESPRPFHKIKSRMLQTIAQLAAQPDGIELNRLLMAMKSATSVSALETLLNNDPAWRGQRGELLLFVDDVAAYEADPADVWNTSLPGSLQREAISNFADRTGRLSVAMSKFATEHATERVLLKAVLAYDADRSVDREQASKFHELIRQTIANRQMFPDHLGPAVRDRFTEKVQDGIFRIHDKGTADPAVAPFGEALVLVDEFGVKQSVMQTADALTVHDSEDVASNPTKLAEGPRRVTGRNGTSVLVDLTTVKGVAEALLDPETNAFVKSVLAPTARDVNQVGTLSTFLNVGNPSLKTILEEADFSDMFKPKGQSLSVGQAHKFISMVEAGVRAKALEGTEEEQDKAYFPIQQMLNEFVVAYSHRPGSETKNKKKVRDQLYVDVAMALQQVAALQAKAPELVVDVVGIIKETLKVRKSRDNSALSSRLQGEAEKAVDDAAILDTYAELLTREAARNDAAIEEALAQGDTALATQLTDHGVQLQQRLSDRIDQMQVMASDDIVESVINMFTLTGDAEVDVDRKGAILRYLGSGNRLGKFQGNYHLINRLNTVLANDQYALSDPDALSLEEWSELGLWASTVYIAESSSRAGSGIKLTPLLLGTEGERLRRYFDPSWSYLLDGLLNPQVLAVASDMATKADWGMDFTAKQVANTIETGLLNEKKLGKWTELVVSAGLKAQKVLSSAAVGLAIPVGGDLPKELAAYVGSGRRTFTPVDATMLTTTTLPVDADGLEWSDELFFKLNNHFASSVVVRDAAGNEVDLMPQVGQTWLGEDSVANSGFKVISRTRLDKALEDAMGTGSLVGPLTVEVAYFDIDTMPYSRDYANNVYFEGVGREADTGTAPGLLAEMFFAPGAISKEAQQNPLNMATKGGAGYRATLIPELDTALTMEQGFSIANVLRAKAKHMWAKTYDVGQPLAGDANSLYKLMTQRHVVVGLNAAGEKEVWWAGKAIEWQHLNAGQPLSSPDFPLTDARLVPLSDAQAQTLLGEPGSKGLVTALTVPQLNLADMDIFPELTPKVLRDRGLAELGETSTLRESELAHRLPLTNIVWTGDRTSGDNTRWEAAIERLRGNQHEMRTMRMNSGFKTSPINDRNIRALRDMLGVEGLAKMFARLGIPMAELRDSTELRLTETLVAKLAELTTVNPSSVVWQHLHGHSSDPSQGILSDTTIRETDGFSGKPEPTWPTYEDIVVIDLDTFLDATRGDYTLAYDQAIDVVRTYSRTGATIVLAGSKGGQKLRSDVGEHLMEGSEGYARMAESAHFFSPADPDVMASRSELALESTLTATQVFGGESIILTHRSDLYSRYGSSENASFFDGRSNQPVWQGESVTLIPSSIGTMFNLPVKGLGPNNQEEGVRDQLLMLLKSPEGRAHLKSLGGDPVGVPIYRNENGVEEFGIRSIDQAMDRLQSLLEAQKQPLAVGEEVMIGDLIPTVASDGSIFLVRVGFKIPEEHKLRAQLATPMDPTDPGQEPGRIAMSINELASAWTTRPPAVIAERNPDPLAGASIRIKYDLSRFGKGVHEGDGWKTIYSPMPNDLAGPAIDLGANGMRVNAFSSQKSPESKQAITGTITNFGWAFALSGIDFRRDMVEFLLGKTDPATFEKDWDTVRTFLDRWASMDHNVRAKDIAAMLSENSFLAVMQAQISDLATEVLGVSANLGDNTIGASVTPNQRLGQIMLATLMAPRMDVDKVIGTPGLLTLDRLDSGAKVQLLPQLFTDALNDFAYPELRTSLFDRANARFPRGPNGERMYQLDPDWTFRILMEHPVSGTSEWVPGTLQISLEYPADENPVNYVQSSVRNDRQGASQHVGFVGFETLGMRTATERASRVESVLFERSGLTDMDEDGGYWRMLRNVPTAKDNPSYSPWRKLTRLQRLEVQEAAKKVVAYIAPVAKDEWTSSEQAETVAVQNKILTLLFGTVAESYRVEIDYLVRQLFGMPSHMEGQPDYAGTVSPAVYLQAASIILQNVEEHLIPTYGGVVPVPHHALMAAVHEANEGRPERWAPRMGTGRSKELAGSWKQWVTTTFGQVRESSDLFDSTFAQDANGFMHTWQTASEDAGPQHVSLDQLRELKLMDPETNSFLASLDPNEEARLTQPVIFETMTATLDAITGQNPTYTREAARTTPAAELSKRIEKHVQWRAARRMPKQQKQSFREFENQGSWYLQSSMDTHNFMHNVVNLSIGMRLLNPALWVSAIFEVYFRNKIEQVTNLAMGESTTVLGTAISKAAEKAGIKPVYSADQLKAIDALANSMGGDNRPDGFLAALYDETTYHNMVEVGRGGIGRKLEGFASFAARATSDPRFGIRARTEAKRYLEAAFEYLRMTDNVVPFDVMIREMNLDSMWLEKNFRTERFDPHRAGMNRVAQVRSLKQTTMGKFIMGGIDGMTASDRTGRNFTGHLLKIPLLFTRFNANALITMTGLGGMDQLLAMSLDQRESSVMGRTKALISGKTYNPAEMDRIDMTDILDSANLFRPFVRGALTQTGLMAFGMMAGSLGMGGEDEETKRRRRLATYLGTPYYYDPRRVENDFRYADAQFLDWLPGPLEALLEVGDETGPGGERMVAQPHWILRQFLSPIVGVERFLNTGDFRQVGWGFSDAFSVMPNSISRLWTEAKMTSDMLAQSAREVDGVSQTNTSEGQALAQKFLISAVGVYEKALMENSFVNAVRNGLDDYDRNPWEKPETLANGNGYKRDPLTGAPVPSTQLEQTIDPRTGEPVVSYDERDAIDAYLHQYAENNLSAAVLLSLFTGQPDTDSTYFRNNMVPAQKSLTLPEKGQDYDETVIMAALHGQGALGKLDSSFANLSQYEAEQMVWATKPAGAFWSGEDVAARAKQMVAAYTGDGMVGGMTLLDDNGREILTKDGARGVLTSLAKGMIELDHPSLAGIHITVDMRKQIQDEWTDELVTEGLAMGLTERVAQIRAKRIWFGDTYNDPNATGLQDLLWTKEIPWSGKVTYNQLNTTFVLGPDGRPWATPFERQNLLQALGIPLPTTPLRPSGGGLSRDSRGNVVDDVYGINTGLIGLERIEDQGELKPPEEEPKAFSEPRAASDTTGSGSGSGWVDFGSGYKKRGYTPYKKRSYSSSGSSSGYPNFTRMYGLPHGQTPYGNDIPFINTSNPMLRRADVRRERVWSERGRLNQWQ